MNNNGFVGQLETFRIDGWWTTMHNFSIHSLHYNMYSTWQHNKDLTCRSSLSPHHLCLAHLLELKYISHVGFHILSIDITIFFINDTFYDIQLFHSPAGHEGASSLHRNELTPRDSNDHFTQLSDDNNTWAIWWLVWIVMWCDDMCENFYDFCVIYYLCKSVSI
jgi:hypothetical protein